MEEIKSQRSDTKEVVPTESSATDMVLSIKQISEYYGVSREGIETIIKRHRSKFEERGMTVLKNEHLKEFKENKIISAKTPTLTVFPKSLILLFAFYLQGNDKANEIKKELLISNPSLYAELEEITLTVGYKKRYEKGFEEMLYPLLGKYNKIEKQVRCGKYRIDYVVNNIIAIEIDEEGHEGYNSKNEQIRHEYIESCGYRVIRYDTRRDNVLEFLCEVINVL